MHWRARALCSDLDGHDDRTDFFRLTLFDQVAICQPCPVRAECLAFAQADELPLDRVRLAQLGTVYGGFTAKQRAAIRFADPVAAVKQKTPIQCGTPRGYQQHLRRQQAACDACKAAMATKRRAERLRRA